MDECSDPKVKMPERLSSLIDNTVDNVWNLAISAAIDAVNNVYLEAEINISALMLTQQIRKALSLLKK